MALKIKRTIIANHIHTWKYMFRIVSFKIGRRGTASKKPAIMVYASNRKDNIFHQFFFKIFLFFYDGAKIRVIVV